MSHSSDRRTLPRSRSAERCLQKKRVLSSTVVPGVKQSTLKLISMKPSPSPPPKPLFLVPKQPNPPSSPVPPGRKHSGTVSGLLYYEGNQEVIDFDDNKTKEENEQRNDHEYGLDSSEFECQVHHRRKHMPTSVSIASLPTVGHATTFKYDHNFYYIMIAKFCGNHITSVVLSKTIIRNSYRFFLKFLC